jgi:hypothetical protein
VLLCFLGTSTLLLSWTFSSRSPHIMAFVGPPALPGFSHNIHNTRHFTWTAGFPHISHFDDSHGSLQRLNDINLHPTLDDSPYDDINALTTLNSIVTQHATPESTHPPQIQSPCPQVQIKQHEEHLRDDASSENTKPHRPFYRWMRSLHRRVNHRGDGEEVWPADAGWKHLESSGTYQRSLRRKLSRHLSSSGSSLGLIAAVQSASISITSASALSRSHRNHSYSHCRSRTERSSRASLSAPRFSEDSVPLEKAKMDVTAIHRSLRRRQILEELISTEESYIGDIRFLIHVSHVSWRVLG